MALWGWNYFIQLSTQSSAFYDENLSFVPEFYVQVVSMIWILGMPGIVARLVGCGVVVIRVVMPIQGGRGVKVFFLFCSFGGVSTFSSSCVAFWSNGFTLFWLSGPQDTLGGETFIEIPFLVLLCIC